MTCFFSCDNYSTRVDFLFTIRGILAHTAMAPEQRQLLVGADDDMMRTAPVPSKQPLRRTTCCIRS